MFDYDELDLWGEDPDTDDVPSTWKDVWAGSYYANPGGAALTAERIGAVQRTIKSFIDTFSRADEQYAVEFGEGQATYTNREAKRIRITSDPLYDKGLGNAQAAKVLVGFACHEASHSRYGAEHETRVRRSFGKEASSAHTLSNLLDDVYIEKAFQAEYPGWTGVFDAAIDWASGKGTTTTDPTGSPILMAVRAVRYAEAFDWTGNEAEQTWWREWADKYATADADKHVAGVRAGLEHIVEQNEARPEKQPQAQQAQGTEASGRDDSSGVYEDADEGEQDEQQASGGEDEQADEGTADEQQGEGEDAPEQPEQPEQPQRQSAREVARAADERSTDKDLARAERESEMTTSGDDASLDPMTREVRDGEASQAMRDLDTLEENEHGHLIEHVRARSLQPNRKRQFDVQTSGTAAAAIRNAFARSRGGHTEITKGTTRGRCDNSSLYRIAASDPRLFHRRNAPSPADWVVWVMIDWSGSMAGRCNETLSAARALAAASRSIPQMRLAVKLWTSRQQSNMAHAGVIDLWESGESLEALNDAGRAQMGSTPDATVMSWARKAILREARSGERPMIVFLSDGEGQYALADEVAAARKAGIEVVSMALDNLSTQQEVYGAKRAIPYSGSITAAAGPLARMLARVMVAQ